MPRLFRESPLMSIWEGSGNVAALDTLRAMAKQPESLEAFFGEVELAAGADSRLDDAVRRVRKELTDLADIEYRARHLVEQLALVFQGSLLVRHAPSAVADAFCGSRLAGDWGIAFGTLPVGVDTATIVERAGVELSA
jgi:putative acyl-CoA dehydrogenase